MRAGAAAAAEQRDAPRLVQQIGQLVERRRPDGTTIGCAGKTRPAGGDAAVVAAGFSATSPGITMTLTPRWPNARRIAISSTRGICSGLETSSQ